MAEAIDTAFVVVKPDTRAFGAETRRQVAQQLRSQPVAAPPIRRDPRADRDLVPRVGVRGPAIRGLLAFGTTLTGVTGGVIAAGLAFRTAFNEMKEGQAVAAQTQSILKGTGNVAGVSAEGIAAYSQELSKISGIDDEIVQTGANIILTFKNVRNVAGEGNAIFDEALSTAVDLSRVAGGAFGDLNSTSKQLGKALNDPIKGMTALSRSGVTFSASQKETIKSLVESGQTLAAQKLILQEVQSQIGPAAEAYGQTLPGAIDRTKNAISNLLGGGLERIAPGLADGAEAVADFFENLQEGGTGSSQIAQAFDLIKSAVTPLFRAIRSEGPRFKSIFQSIQTIVRNLMPTLKVLATVVGVALVVAFKVAIRILDRFFKNIVIVQGILKELVQAFLAAVDGILGGVSFLTDALSKVPLIGDKFAGVSDDINAARDYLRSFSEELDQTDGKEVNVKIKVKQEITSATTGRRTADAPDATGGKTKTVADIPGPREAKEQQLIAKIGIEQARGNVAAERALLTQLVAFYAESLRLAKERGVVRRDYQIKYEQALADIRAIDQAASDAAKQAADDAKADHEAFLAAMDQERRDLLLFRIQIAAGTKRIIRDDKAAWAAYIAYLKTRVAVAKAAGVGIAAAKAELRQARLDATQTVKDFIQAKFDEQEAFLQGQVDLFDITGAEGKLAAAYNKLIRFYRRMIKREGLTRLERQKYRIALAQTRKDLAELKDETSDTGKDGATFGQLAVDFLKNLHGFSSNLASNVMPRGTSTGVTEALAGATAQAAAATKAAMNTAAGVRTGIDPATGRPLGESGRDGLAPRGTSAAEQALANREAAQGPATAAQFERLLSQNAAILRVLRRIAQDQDHPTAKFNRKASPASIVVGVS